ncbi:MAG TPA: DUF4271 domain-containing protein [Saprospiraceae bacterium]|nr:DUF4271 domain-containing protein [Saprospiraceae bacterium]HMQ81617.1 DUF4271 domain-containing protein [Saprospiraceae bacterium]
MRNPILVLFLCCVCVPGYLLGQNPFDLTERLEVLTPTEGGTAVSNNPFDLLEPISAEAPRQASPPLEVQTKARPQSVSTQGQYDRFILVVSLASLLLFTLMITLFRNFFGRAYRAFLNDNVLSQLQRDQEGTGSLPYYLWYLLFFINAGILVFQLSHHFEVFLPNSLLLGLLASIGLIAAGFLLKHLVLLFLAFVFPIQKEVKLYSFTIIVVGIILGVVLLPLNLLFAYAVPEILPYIIYLIAGIVAGIYVFRSFRGIFIAGRFLSSYIFHFLLYICAIEIAPVVILLKIISF